MVLQTQKASMLQFAILIGTASSVRETAVFNAADTVNESSQTLLPENDACSEACGKGGVCEACGGMGPGSVAHLCCRQRSRSAGCDIAKAQNPEWRSDGDRQCITLKEGTWNVIPNNEVEKHIPHTAEGLPDTLKGLIWMDQSGYYAHSDVGESGAAPDAVVSFADTRDGYKLGDAGPNKQKVTPFGPTWTWFNQEHAYDEIPRLVGKGFHYVFEWDKEYKKAAIHLKMNMFNPPRFLAQFNMEYQESHADTTLCPPPTREEWFAEQGFDPATTVEDAELALYNTAYKKRVAKCAKWARPSYIPLLGTYWYYAFEIIDKDGQKTPYYDKYVEWVNSQSKPNAQKAMENGFINEHIMDENTMLLGTLQ